MWIVMAATELTSRDSNRERCFDRNATGLTEAEAHKEAMRRNEVERAAGHENVFWYAVSWG